MTNTLLAFFLSFLLTFVCGIFMIPLLRRYKLGQSILEIGPKWHLSKQGTPTMGGFLFMTGISAASFVFGYPLLREGRYGWFYALGFAWVCGLIGLVDDIAKVKKKRNQGLTALQKLLLQLSAAAAFLALLRLTGQLTTELYIPFLKLSLSLPWAAYIAAGIVYVTGFVNAVNITDGVDGLCSGVTFPVALLLGALAIREETDGAALLAFALAGGLLGFLVYNFKPAKVFMGDTGSLFLGGLLCGLAFMIDKPLLLIPAGIWYLLEMFSVILQVGYFKLTKGKRIFKMAPIHHHYEMCGLSEVKIFAMAAFGTIVLCVVTYFLQ